jgi:hypothetical protein
VWRQRFLAPRAPRNVGSEPSYARNALSWEDKAGEGWRLEVMPATHTVLC